VEEQSRASRPRKCGKLTNALDLPKNRIMSHSQTGALRGWMVSGVRSKFGAPMLEPEVFQKQMHCIKESTCDIVGTFRRPPQ